MRVPLCLAQADDRPLKRHDGDGAFVVVGMAPRMENEPATGAQDQLDLQTRPSAAPQRGEHMVEPVAFEPDHCGAHISLFARVREDFVAVRGLLVRNEQVRHPLLIGVGITVT